MIVVFQNSKTFDIKPQLKKGTFRYFIIISKYFLHRVEINCNLSSYIQLNHQFLEDETTFPCRKLVFGGSMILLYEFNFDVKIKKLIYYIYKKIIEDAMSLENSS